MKRFAKTLILLSMLLLASWLVSLMAGKSLSAGGLALGLLALLPSAMMYIGFGLLIGSLFNDKATPGLCSIIISLGSFLGSIRFDAESAGGVLLDICQTLLFPLLYQGCPCRSVWAGRFSDTAGGCGDIRCPGGRSGCTGIQNKDESELA